MRKVFCLLGFLVITCVHSQIDSVVVGNITPGGYLDTLFDQQGNKYPLNKYSVNSVNAPISTSCSAGYFNIYYATGSGMDNLTNPTHIAKRGILCKLFTDISNFIQSPLSVVTNTAKQRLYWS